MTWSPACGTRWADDAFIRDVESGIFFDPDKMHVLNHKGKYLSVQGPLNIARPVQGWPVIVQAGASDVGRQLAAETAEMVFTALPNMKAGQAFCADVKGRMQKAGRNPEHMEIMPACFVMLGETKRRGAGEARPARQQGELRQRHRLAVDRARPRRLEVRSGQAAARRHPREQRLGERPRARHRARQAREPDRAPARAAARRLRRPRHGRHRQDRRRRDGGMARRPRPPTASPSNSRICPAGSTSSATSSCRNCSAAACSARNTRARRCAKISGCRGRATASSTPRPWRRNRHERDRELPRPCLLRRARPARRREKLCAAAGQEIRRQGRADARQPGRPASARKLPAHHRQGSIHRRGLLAGAQPEAA